MIFRILSIKIFVGPFIGLIEQAKARLSPLARNLIGRVAGIEVAEDAVELCQIDIRHARVPSD